MAFVLRRLPLMHRHLYSVIKISPVTNLSLSPAVERLAGSNVKDTSEPEVDPRAREPNVNEIISATNESKIGVGEYVTKIMKTMEAEGKLKTKRRAVWLIRRHMEIVEKFCQSPKQVLGLSLDEFKRRVEVLQGLDINPEDALVIATIYPSCLSLESPTLFPMVSLLKRFGCYLPKHFMKNPHVFSLDAKACESNLEQLRETGLTSENIGNLIDVNPIVLTATLSKEAKDFAAHAKNYQSSSNIVRLALKSSLLKSGEKVSQNEDFEDVVSFLNELKIDLSKLMQKCPEFFCTSCSQLLETYQFLSGAPLYCEKSHIKKLVTSNPHGFLQMNKSSFQQSITSLSKIIDSNIKLYFLLQKSPMLFVDSSSILLQRIELLETYGFSQKEIAGLLERAAFVFCDEKSSTSSNLEKKLQILLAENDITTAQVCKSAFILRTPLDKIHKRLFFIRCRKPDVLKRASLNEILFSNNDVFISDICQSSLKEYLNTVELVDPFRLPRTGKK